MFYKLYLSAFTVMNYTVGLLFLSSKNHNIMSGFKHTHISPYLFVYALVITSGRSGQETCHMKNTPTTNTNLFAPIMPVYS